MSRILIVSRTRMRNGVCVGGVNLENNSFVRLHTEHGANLPIDASYQIGEIWELTLDKPWNPRPAPHVEDKMVLSASKVETILNMSSYIRGLEIQIYEGSINIIFEGKLCYTKTGKPFISHNAVPSQSVCFWIPDADLIPYISYDKQVYRYKDCTIPYVGLTSAERIPAGSIVRMSLANWWKPDDDNIEERCYLQLSGFYK